MVQLSTIGEQPARRLGKAMPRPHSDDGFAEALRRIATSVSIITSSHRGKRRGWISHDFLIAAEDPPTLLISVPSRSARHASLRVGGAFCANVLADGDSEIAGRFADRAVPGEDAFDSRTWQSIATGAPALVDCLASLDCLIVAEMQGPGFTAIAGEVVAVKMWNPDRPPLIHHDRTYFRL